MLTRQRLKKFVRYDQNTGMFIQLISRGGVKAGDKAGSVTNVGYKCISIDDRRYQAHRLAWLYVYGKWPSGNLDHINMDRLDNRISNLRVANQSQNMANGRKHKNNTSGLKGVSFCRLTNRWRASIMKNRKCINLGRYSTPQEAYQAYTKAAEGIYGKFARVE